MKISIITLACLCTCLDGYILIFLGYNSSILNKEWNWDARYIPLLDVIYHLFTALGSLASCFTSYRNNSEGLNYAIIFNFLAFLFSFALMYVHSFFEYMIIFIVICLSNGHLQNMAVNWTVQKFDPQSRAVFFVFAECFNHVGKLIFASVLYANSEMISQGHLSITVFPILGLIMIQVVTNIVLLNVMKEKARMKKRLADESVKHGLTKPEIKFSVAQIIGKPLQKLFSSSYRDQTYMFMFLNASLGIVFFSVVTVFPHLNNQLTHSDLFDEIFTSKIFHTIFSTFLPLIFIFRDITRKRLLIATFLINIVLNIFVVSNIYNSSLNLHIFRFVWNLSYMTLNLYCCEVPKSIMNFASSFMYLIFRLGCIFGMFTVDKLISVSIYLPITLNFIILIGNIFLTLNLSVETHMKPLKEIETEMFKEYI
jgi:hypothetical protein